MIPQLSKNDDCIRVVLYNPACKRLSPDAIVVYNRPNTYKRRRILVLLLATSYELHAHYEHDISSYRRIYLVNIYLSCRTGE